MRMVCSPDLPLITSSPQHDVSGVTPGMVLCHTGHSGTTPVCHTGHGVVSHWAWWCVTPCIVVPHRCVTLGMVVCHTGHGGVSHGVWWCVTQGMVVCHTGASSCSGSSDVAFKDVSRHGLRGRAFVVTSSDFTGKQLAFVLHVATSA
jgi:hypothetical protein